MNEDYEAFLSSYIAFLEDVIYDETGITTPELIYTFCNGVIDTLSEEE